MKGVLPCKMKDVLPFRACSNLRDRETGVVVRPLIGVPRRIRLYVTMCLWLRANFPKFSNSTRPWHYVWFEYED